ncbi:MAG: DMT family transporter [Planctomycetota bacterium]
MPVLAFCICTLIWGSTWLAIKIGNADVASLNAAGLRFVISASILLCLQYFNRAPMPKNRREWNLIIFVGIVLIGLDYGLIYWAEETLATGLTSVLFAVMPLFTLICARVLKLETITFRKVAGIVISIAGVCVLSWKHVGFNTNTLLPAAAVLGAALCSALTTTATKKYGKELHPITLNAWSSVIGVFCLYSGALVRGEGFQIPSTPTGWLAMSYLALGGSVAAFLLYFWLLKHWDATRTGLIPVLTPILAVTLGVVFGNEPFDISFLAGSALVLAGVFIAMRSGKK